MLSKNTNLQTALVAVPSVADSSSALGLPRELRSGSLDAVLSVDERADWAPTVSLRLDPGTISLDRVTLLQADDDAPILPARVEAEEFTSSSGGSLVAEGTSPSGNVGGTYDGGGGSQVRWRARRKSVGRNRIARSG